MSNPYVPPPEKSRPTAFVRRLRAWQASLALILIGVVGYFGSAVVAMNTDRSTASEFHKWMVILPALGSGLLVLAGIVLGLVQLVGWAWRAVRKS